ncbi:hypothetical protein SLEP1_g16339 [Rubroshorea leprosula]|uniref:Uncharacterized protein n=1 Tax=Rubroshorea leprosula TaxID=152421 RepID=A0AAV5IZT3_9ROSI|nr:hypothetical protein SLEP1_g16339 [Rubroshorea leprosula]
MLVRDLHNLRELYLDGVNISANGSEWCSSLPLAVPKLQVLSLSYTQLSGPICKSLQQLQLLSTLHLNGNNFSSEMPKKLMLLPGLQSLDVSVNRLLSGTLPEFPKTSVQEFLSLYFTSFYGQLPDSIGNLKLLKELELRDCNFSGLIPYSLANLSQITHIGLSSNHFQGWLPFFATPEEKHQN